MIIDSSQGDIQTCGDVKEFKTSIDPKNLEFITTLLSSNLYSDPEQSFIREIVSNGWDSHVEAGTTDVPVIIRFKREANGYSSSWEVTIRDFGTGLSPQRFQEVYCNIGSSTKRESNDYIGGFGIGKYSALACSNTVYITSYYEGKAYYYVMVKSGNSITTNLLMEKPTSEKNGVEVTVKGIHNIDPYQKALKYIVFFPNIYVDGANDYINEVKLKKFKNFSVATINISSKLLLGNVLYACNNSLVSSKSYNFLNSINSTGIVINFNVGEINITPNRESIIYTEETIAKINQRIADAEKELNEYICSKLVKDYDDFREYAKVVTRVLYWNPAIEEFTHQYGSGYRVNNDYLQASNLTCNGKRFIQNQALVQDIVNLSLPRFKGFLYDDKFYTKRPPWSKSDYFTMKSPNILILGGGGRMTELVKSYLRENYDDYSIMTEITLDEFKEYVKEELKSHVSSQYFDEITEALYNSIMKDADYLDVTTDSNFLQYKADSQANKITGVTEVRDVILYVWEGQGTYRMKHPFKKFSEALSYIKGRKQGIIILNMDVENCYTIATAAYRRGFCVIQARKDIVADLRKLKLSCMVELEDFIHKDPIVKRVASVDYALKDTRINIHYVANRVIDTIPEDKKHLYEEILKIYNNYVLNDDFNNFIKKFPTTIDDETVKITKDLVEYCNKFLNIESLVNGITGTDKAAVTIALLLRKRAYRISKKSYELMQNNNLIRVLCRKG